MKLKKNVTFATLLTFKFSLFYESINQSILGLFLMILVFFSSCSREKIVEVEEQTTNEVQLRAYNNSMQTISISLSKLLLEQEVRDVIREKIALKFDGDFNVLFKDIQHIKFSDGQTFLQKLDRNISSENDLTGFLEKNPKIQIAFPVNFENWDAKTAPLVTFIPFEYKELETLEVDAFDANENVYKLSTIENPSMPVIVVSQNERIDDNGVVNPSFLNTNHLNATNTNNSNDVEDRALRTNGNPEYIRIFNCFDLNAIEGWLAGTPEIRYTAVSNLVQPVAQDFLPSYSRSSYGNTGWLSANKLITTSWTIEAFGPYITYFFVEEDGGSQRSQSYTTPTATINGTTYTGITTTFYYRDEDDLMGISNVLHTSQVETFYALSLITFRMKNWH